MPNVVKDYKWTVAQGAIRDEAPRIYAWSYKITNNAILDAINAYSGVLGSRGGVQYYDKLHESAEQQETYVFPFFNDEVRSFQNNWGSQYVGSTNGSQAAGSEFASNLASLAGNLITTYGQYQAGAIQAFTDSKDKTGALFEPPKYYQYDTSDNALSLDFLLINTDGEGDYSQNYELIKNLIKINRFSRSDGILSDPPVLWKVRVPGYRYIPWASCNVSVNLLGKRIQKVDKIIPEGYRIGLVFNPLYTEPREFERLY